jgi:hypothetical protein
VTSRLADRVENGMWKGRSVLRRATRVSVSGSGVGVKMTQNSWPREDKGKRENT